MKISRLRANESRTCKVCPSYSSEGPTHYQYREDSRPPKIAQKEYRGLFRDATSRWGRQHSNAYSTSLESQARIGKAENQGRSYMHAHLARTS